MRRLLLALLIVLPTMAHAESDHDRALLLRHKGEILPLSDIVRHVSERYPGQILEVELKERKPHPVYEIEMLGDDGVVREITVDAVDGRMLGVEKD